ncbi:DUF1796 family putative cysteine peptidase [Paraburkholderia sp. BR14374]|uniref:DUF1796 family putative cysteine peptidase n=1 Tax=Paraburkholderia sp. BR14374 TaxID=3237007 RepID=UPI0034CF6194
MQAKLKFLEKFAVFNRKNPRTRSYDRVISIGSNCEVTWNIRHHFETRTAYPFDWWMTPFQALLDVLDARFSGLFEPSHLAIPADRGTVVDTRFNLMYHHDFARDEEGRVIVDDVEKQLPDLRKKYARRIDRFVNELDGKKVLFVRNRCGNDPVYLNGDYGDIQPDQCIEIHRVLSALLPRTRFDLFATNKPGFDAFSYRGSEIFSDSIVEYGDCSDYMVSPKGWAEMFERNRIVLRAGHEASTRTLTV